MNKKYKILYHGTTKDNYNKILKSGFNPTNNPWSCSGSREIYFWDLSKIREYDNEEENINFCIYQAFESAKITAAYQNFQGSELIVLELKVLAENVEDDYSCENMEYASCADIDFLEVEDIIKIHQAKEGYNTFLRLFYLISLLGNQHFQFYNLEPIAQTALNALKGQDIYIEDLYFNGNYKSIKL